jgi:hypothetical protein
MVNRYLTTLYNTCFQKKTSRFFMQEKGLFSDPSRIFHTFHSASGHTPQILKGSENRPFSCTKLRLNLLQCPVAPYIYVPSMNFLLCYLWKYPTSTSVFTQLSFRKDFKLHRHYFCVKLSTAAKKLKVLVANSMNFFQFFFSKFTKSLKHLDSIHGFQVGRKKYKEIIFSFHNLLIANFD